MNNDGKGRLDLLGTLADLGQTALAALEAADLAVDPAERRGMAADARGLVLEMILVARRFAGLPDSVNNNDTEVM